MPSRAVTALVGLAASLLVSVVVWHYTGQVFLFLVVPFVPILLRRRGEDDSAVAVCPTCGYRTRNPEFEHCPRDGTRLRR